LATDLELQLVRPETRAAIRRALEAVADRAAARRLAAELAAAGTASGVDWAAIATEADTTAWAVVPERDRFGIIVASWDWLDWVCATVEDAKRIAEEIDARPSLPSGLRVEDQLPDD
jgi:hypothetical protein